jgi:hypothetical protein
MIGEMMVGNKKIEFFVMILALNQPSIQAMNCLFEKKTAYVSQEIAFIRLLENYDIYYLKSLNVPFESVEEALVEVYVSPENELAHQANRKPDQPLYLPIGLVTDAIINKKSIFLKPTSWLEKGKELTFDRYFYRWFKDGKEWYKKDISAETRLEMLRNLKARIHFLEAGLTTKPHAYDKILENLEKHKKSIESILNSAR